MKRFMLVLAALALLGFSTSVALADGGAPTQDNGALLQTAVLHADNNAEVQSVCWGCRGGYRGWGSGYRGWGWGSGYWGGGGWRGGYWPYHSYYYGGSPYYSGYWSYPYYSYSYYPYSGCGSCCY